MKPEGNEKKIIDLFASRLSKVSTIYYNQLKSVTAVRSIEGEASFKLIISNINEIRGTEKERVVIEGRIDRDGSIFDICLHQIDGLLEEIEVVDYGLPDNNIDVNHFTEKDIENMDIYVNL